MAKKTVVSNYIKDKFNNIKKDSFLEEISKLSILKQKESIIEEIGNINEYIRIIKNNNNYYDKINGRLELNNNIKNYIHKLKKIIIKYQEYYKYLCLLEYYDGRKERIDAKIEFESSEIKLNSTQIIILNELNNSNIFDYNFNDLISVVKYLIQNFTIDKLVLINLILSRLEKDFIDNNYSDEYFVSISSVKNILTYKINYLDKNDDNRKVLKELKKYIKSIINLSKEQEKKRHDYCIDIINILLDNELYLQKIIQRSPKLINIIDEENNTFAYFAITKYLDLYLLELQGKQSSIPKEKYLDIYYMIENDLNYKYKDIDKIKINELINSFKETIKNGGFKRSTYLEVVKNFDEIFNQNDELDNKKTINKEIVNFENENILNDNKFDNRKDLTKEYTIVVNNSNLYNYAYSINKNSSGNYILKVHVTDISKYIKPGSYLDEMLKDLMFKESDCWLDEKVLSKFSLSEKEIKPVITFECEILPNGKNINLKSYRSNIIVDDIYSFKNFNNKIKNDELLLYLELGKILNKNLDKSNYAKSLTDIFDKSILAQVGTYFDKNKYPYIYKVQFEQNSDDYIKILTQLNYLFSKIDKEDANTFYNIICDDVNYSKYSIKPNYHHALGQKYYTDLLIPLNSYIGLYLQRLVNIFMIDSSEIEKTINKNNYKKEIKEIINLANIKKQEKRINKQKKLNIN